MRKKLEKKLEFFRTKNLEKLEKKSSVNKILITSSTLSSSKVCLNLN